MFLPVIFICNLAFAINWRFLVSDKFWEEVELLLPPKQVGKPGRPRMDDRQAFCAIFYVSANRYPMESFV